jgi:flagellar biosynthesis component FlhA
MDFWINAQELSLDRQDELKESLINEFDRINMTDRRNISRESEEYKRLIGEIVEMLSLKLTVLSLMESIPEESFLPEPIK